MNLEDLYRLLRAGHVQAQGIVDTVREPLLVLDRNLRVIAANRSFFETFKVGRDETIDTPLYELGGGQWDIAELRHLLEAVIPKSTAIEGYEVEHDFPGLGRRTMLLNARKLFHADNNSMTLLLAIEDITERQKVEREQDLRFRELRHRVRNLLTTIQAMANQTTASGRSGEEYRDAFLGRLTALVQAHELAFSTQSRIDLATLVGLILEPYAGDRTTGRIAIAGPVVTLAMPAHIQALALVLHEMATNAVKHGALSVPEGHVLISWEVDAHAGKRWIRLCWTEQGGPSLEPPTTYGFGTELIKSATSSGFGKQADLTFSPRGLEATLMVLLD